MTYWQGIRKIEAERRAKYDTSRSQGKWQANLRGCEGMLTRDFQAKLAWLKSVTGIDVILSN